MLGGGAVARDRYYDALRRVGIAPTPADEAGHLYAPNPVVVPRRLVEAMTDDLNVFCDRRRSEIRDGRELRSLLPETLRELVGEDVAARIHDDLGHRHPMACIDAYLVEGQDGLDRAYLEWQTFPAYPALALTVLGALREAYPGIEAAGGSFSPRAAESLEGLSGRMREWFLAGVEDDPRRCVVVDLEPERQETRREFRFVADLTGGERGFGVIDPREVFYREGQASYRRGDEEIPIRAVFSRLVHDDLEALEGALRGEERDTVRRFLGDATLDWRVHPLHFLYGTKGDFPGFCRERLSSALPPCRTVTAELIDELRASGADVLGREVQKPIEGHGGREIRPAPRVDDLVPGFLLQDLIEPAPCHPTLAGPRAPEVRVMGIPLAADGRLECSSVFTRVKAPDEFRSNAGVTARAAIPGTGEGYAVFVD